MAKHLLYHVMPIASNGIWQWNIEKLKPYLPLFDGVRVCSIVTQFTKKRYTGDAQPPDFFRAPLITDQAEAVIHQLKDYGFKFIVQENDPNLQEVLAFEPLMNCVKDFCRPDDYTLYCHAKGVTRFWQHPAIRWTEILYETMLGYWPLVEEVLQRAPVAGSFLKWGAGWPIDSESKWHYSGSWYWFKNACLFSKPDWRRIDKFWSGIEPYPSLHFDESEAGAVFHEAENAKMKLYDPVYLKTLEQELLDWKEANKGKQTDLTFPKSWYPSI